ncbi:5'_nucleotidase family protein [Hexamita inflata]|uniref:5' nucleotidase family protein n=1 Tax=Hexamita inflata TaxID=28002 RepID=A0AA86PD82_9EUKA|nr:5' nucleotidase family protein [Hexamita inflata]CAI9935430.1 5' nucleotidase family protein [Hexamita inflata]
MLIQTLVLNLRIIHSSDTHGWLFGNPHDAEQNANFGDILSFISASKSQRTTIALDSGDFIQGCGLSDATKVQGEYVLEAWRQSFQHNEFFDYVTLGNHDEMIAESVKIMNENLLDENVHNHTISYNTFSNGGAVSARFKFATLDNVKYLITGFMYDMTPVQPLTIKSFMTEMSNDQLFSSLVKNADAFIILIHIGWNQHPEGYHFIYEQIRSMSPGPIIILGGHEHQAAYIYPVRINESFKNPFPETMSEGFDVNVIFAESANYFKELTIIDFDVQKINGVRKLINVNRTIIKSNKQLFLKEVQLNEFNNANANKIQAYIDEKVTELNILKQIGVAPQPYIFLNPNTADTNSIWNLWMKEIVPKTLQKLPDASKLKGEVVNIIGTSFFNNDILQGPIFVNDLYVTVPYTNEWFYDYPEIKGKDLKAIFCEMIGGCKAVKAPTGFPKYFLSENVNDLEAEKIYSVILTDYDNSRFEDKAKKLGISIKRDEGYYGNITPFAVYQQFVETYWKM